MPKAKKATATCDLCCDPLESSQDILNCEGGCNGNVHRYCAGVTRAHFQELKSGCTPFVCQYCSLKTNHAVVQQLTAEVTALKAELQAAKAELVELQTAAAIKLSATCVPTQPRNYAEALASKQPKPKGRPPNARRPRGTPSSLTSRQDTAATPQPQLGERRGKSRPGQKEKVEGARKMWGALKSTTPSVVSSTLAKLTTVQQEELLVKRKYKEATSGDKPVLWWFVIRGNEDVLQKLDNEWTKVSLQTTWKLLPLLRFSEGPTNDFVHPSVDASPPTSLCPHQQLPTSPPLRELPPTNDNFLSEVANNQAESPPQQANQ